MASIAISVAASRVPASASSCEDTNAMEPGIGVAFASAGDRYREAAAEVVAALHQLGQPNDLESRPARGDGVPGYEELAAGLDRYKQLAFAGKQSQRFAVSGKRLNRLSRRLHEAYENQMALRDRVEEEAARLLQMSPGHPAAACRSAGLALMILREWDMSDGVVPAAPGRDGLADAVLASVSRDATVRLALFVCPPVDFGAIGTARPSDYLKDDLHGSVLSRQVPRLRSLFRNLEAIGVAVELFAIVGDTDEDDYIWPILGHPTGLDGAALEQARSRLAVAVEAYLAAPTRRHDQSEPKVATADSIRVLRLSALPADAAAEVVRRRLAAAPSLAFDCSDVAAEAQIMRKLFEPGSYYQGLVAPGDQQLYAMIKLKFAAYAVQGLALRALDPALVLLQTERPSRLRNRMINAGLAACAMPPIPAVDLYRPEAAFVL